MRRLWGRVEEADKAELELSPGPALLRFWFPGESGRVGGDGGRGGRGQRRAGRAGAERAKPRGTGPLREQGELPGAAPALAVPAPLGRGSSPELLRRCNRGRFWRPGFP